MFKNFFIIGLLSILLMAGFSPNTRWAVFNKEKTMLDRNHVLAVFETEHQFATTYEERKTEKPKKCVQIVLSSGESLYTTDTSYDDVKSELLKDR